SPIISDSRAAGVRAAVKSRHTTGIIGDIRAAGTGVIEGRRTPDIVGDIRAAGSGTSIKNRLRCPQNPSINNGGAGAAGTRTQIEVDSTITLVVNTDAASSARDDRIWPGEG